MTALTVKHPSRSASRAAADTEAGSGSGRRTACVLGGGIAGVAAAVRLAGAGWRVTLVESRNHLGGRATSHTDPRTGEPLDNCQHVLMRCCTTLLDLFERLGVIDQIEWHDRLHFVDDRGRHHVMRAAPLPAPLHLGPALLTCRFLSGGAKLAVARGMAALLRGPPPPDELSFAEWLQRHRQPDEAVERFWSVVIVSALNVRPADASAAAAAKVFVDAFLRGRRSYQLGVPRVPLVRLYENTARLLRAAGGAVRVGTSVAAINVEGTSVESVTFAGGSGLRAAAYVSALPLERLDGVLSAGAKAADPRLSRLTGFSFSPIVGLHLWFDRRVLTVPHAALLGSPLHWVFDRGLATDGSQHLHGVISAATEWADLPRDEIVRRVTVELHRYLPGTRAAVVRRAEVYKERRATFAASPGVERLRPPAVGTIRNLFLAGDYCRTGWPATMESAARSGYLAADGAASHAAMAGMRPPGCEEFADAPVGFGLFPGGKAVRP